MVWRVASLLLCQLAGGAVGWLFGLPGALTAGVVLGALAWLAMDLYRSQRVLRWL
ncbi:MAG: PAS domain-containing sensor histidine kinase, partial [Ramlibacter sp.]|nr:PAS domain-containing sensor histidine kinase [Ramlibacter sp.]